MPMTDQDREWHRAYQKMTVRDETAVAHAFHAAREALKESGFNAATDDRAESRAAAIARYLIESNPEPKESPIESCCDNEQRTMNGGCKNCGDPCF